MTVDKDFWTPDSELVKRFVSDNNFPINVMEDWDIFRDELILWEPLYHTVTKWHELQEGIRLYYHGNAQKFLEAYYELRDRIIKSFLNSEEYQEWNNDRCLIDNIDRGPQIPTKYNSIWNQDAALSGKTFWSFDMKAANFQIYQHYGLISNKDYYDFINSYNNFDDSFLVQYFANSKYTRQVIFGKLNASKCIKLQRAWIQHIWNHYFVPMLPEGTHPAAISNDEIIIEEIDEPTYLRLQAMLLDPKTKPPFELKPKKVKPLAYEYFRRIRATNDIRKIGEFYVNEIDPVKQRKYKCLDNTYAKMVHNMMFGDPVFNKNLNIVMMGKSLVEVLDFGGISLKLQKD